MCKIIRWNFFSPCGHRFLPNLLLKRPLSFPKSRFSSFNFCFGFYRIIQKDTPTPPLYRSFRQYTSPKTDFEDWQLGFFLSFFCLFKRFGISLPILPPPFKNDATNQWIARGLGWGFILLYKHYSTKYKTIRFYILNSFSLQSQCIYCNMQNLEDWINEKKNNFDIFSDTSDGWLYMYKTFTIRWPFTVSLIFMKGKNSEIIVCVCIICVCGGVGWKGCKNLGHFHWKNLYVQY